MVVTALIMGLAGSLHCAGMCSPLAMAVTNMSSKVFLNRLIYNAGRILTYAALGALVSGMGYLLPISRFQNLLSILLGITLLLAGCGFLKISIPVLSKAAAQFTHRIKNLFSLFLGKKNSGSVFVLGALNGLLPCGLILIALSYSVTLRSPGQGLLFMTVFGLGTLPVMLGLTSVLPVIVKRFDFNISHITRGMLVLSGLLLIARVFIVQIHHEKSIQQGIIDVVLCR